MEQGEKNIPKSKGTNKIDQAEKKKHIDERKELENLIKAQEDSLMNLTDEANNLLPTKDAIRFNNELIIKQALTESANIINSSAQFYMPSEMIDSTPYIQQKMMADTAILSDIMQQSKISDYSIVKMIEIIDEGNLHPRAFEVLSNLQKIKIDIIKLMQQAIISFENGYKSLKEDWKVKQNEEALNIEAEVEDTGLITRGTRGVLQQLRSALDEVNEEIENN